MDFLSSNRIIHRDLAARNVLLCGKNLVKICDFGLAKDIQMFAEDEYVKVSSKKVPYRWMAPESLDIYPVFGICSDVWSYGESCSYFK